MNENEAKTEGCNCGEDCECQKEIPEAPPVENDAAPQQKVSHLQMRRAQQYEERIKRWMNKNQGRTREQAIHALAAEDEASMPLDKKVQRLQAMLYGVFNKMGEDLGRMQHNQFSIADSMDVNFLAIAKMFAKLGIPLEEHKKFMEEARAEIEEHRKKYEEQRKAEIEKQMKAQKEAAEKKAMVSEAKEVADAPAKEAPGADVPKDATVFGG